MSIKLPILIMAFNRPELTKKVFLEIKKYKPKKIYFSVDGPRKFSKEDSLLVNQVYKSTKIIDWNCKVFKNFSKKNIGIKNKVCQSLHWFFSKEKMGIILEDDCIPHISFFKYCEILLKKYEQNKNILMINGNNFQDGIKRGTCSYYFSNYFSTYGWAGWRRTLNNYDKNIKFWPKWKKSKNFLEIKKNMFKKEFQYWNKIYDLTHKGKIRTWDYQLMLKMWRDNQCAITPNVNLVSHIGLGVSATNSKAKKRGVPVKEIKFPLVHPKQIKINQGADRYSFIFMPYQGLFLYFPFNLISFFWRSFRNFFNV